MILPKTGGDVACSLSHFGEDDPPQKNRRVVTEILPNCVGYTKDPSVTVRSVLATLRSPSTGRKPGITASSRGAGWALGRRGGSAARDGRRRRRARDRERNGRKLGGYELNFHRPYAATDNDKSDQPLVRFSSGLSQWQGHTTHARHVGIPSIGYAVSWVRLSVGPQAVYSGGMMPNGSALSVWCSLFARKSATGG